MNYTYRFSILITIVMMMIACPFAFAEGDNVAMAPAVEATCSKDITIEGLKAKVTEMTKDFKDVTMTAVVTYKNKRALAKVEESFTRLYEFKTAKVTAKSPDKLKTEGRLGMLSFTYIVNNTTRIVRVPTIRVNKTDEYKNEPSKLQDLLDIGLLTQGAWRVRQLVIMPDPDAVTKGEMLINAPYPNNTMQNLFWIDTTNFCLKRFEKRDANGKSTIKLEYSKPKYFGNAIWLPTVVEIFAPDGERAGAMELRDIQVNTGITDSLFE